MAFEQLVGDWCSHPVDKRRPHCRIISQHLHSPFFSSRRRLASFTSEFRARRCLVFFHDVLGDLLYNWILGLRPGGNDTHEKHSSQNYQATKFHTHRVSLLDKDVA
jgi:hypothetical protein